MITKYRARLGASIQTVEIDRETGDSVWVAGRRRAKRTSWEWYCDTWEEAHKILLDIAQNKVASARRQLDYENGALGNVKGMKPPTAGQQGQKT